MLTLLRRKYSHFHAMPCFFFERTSIDLYNMILFLFLNGKRNCSKALEKCKREAHLRTHLHIFQKPYFTRMFEMICQIYYYFFFGSQIKYAYDLDTWKSKENDGINVWWICIVYKWKENGRSVGRSIRRCNNKTKKKKKNGKLENGSKIWTNKRISLSWVSTLNAQRSTLNDFNI